MAYSYDKRAAEKKADTIAKKGLAQLEEFNDLTTQLFRKAKEIQTTLAEYAEEVKMERSEVGKLMSKLEEALGPEGIVRSNVLLSHVRRLFKNG